MKNYIYFPLNYKKYDNPYCLNFASWLNDLGLTDITPNRIRDLIKLRGKRSSTVAIVNWLENDLITKSGSFSFKGFLKTLLVLFLLRASASQVILVKHNHYPHNTNKKSIRNVMFCMRILEKISSTVCVHDKELSSQYDHYIPHPLYESMVNDDFYRSKIPENYLCYFGRLEKYKNIYELVVNWPTEAMPLVIIGTGRDTSYVQKIKDACSESINVVFIEERLNDPDAGALVSKSKGVIIPNQGDDMIVSGVVYFALSYYVPVYSNGLLHTQDLSIKYPAIFRNLDHVTSYDRFTKVACSEQFKLFYEENYTSNPLAKVIKNVSI